MSVVAAASLSVFVADFGPRNPGPVGTSGRLLLVVGVSAVILVLSALCRGE